MFFDPPIKSYRQNKLSSSNPFQNEAVKYRGRKVKKSSRNIKVFTLLKHKEEIAPKSKSFEMEPITDCLAKAKMRYLQDPLNIENRKKIDGALIQSYKGTLSTEEKTIIDNYWEHMASSPDGLTKMLTKMKAVENRSYILFVKTFENSLDEIMKDFKQETKEEKKNKHSQFIVSHLQELLQNTNRQLNEERELCLDNGDKLVLDYLLLTGSFQMTVTMNKLIRNTLSSKVESLEKQIKPPKECVSKKNSELIEMYQGIIARSKQTLKTMIQTIDLDLKLEIEKDIKEMENIIIQLDPTEALKGESLEEIGALIPKKTAFEQLYYEIMEISAEAQSSLTMGYPNALFNLQINPNCLENPEEYFLQRFIELDFKKLKLLRIG